MLLFMIFWVAGMAVHPVDVARDQMRSFAERRVPQ